MCGNDLLSLKVVWRRLLNYNQNMNTTTKQLQNNYNQNYEHRTSAYNTAHNVFLENDCVPSLLQDVFAKELIKSPLKQISLKFFFSTNPKYINLITIGLTVAVDNHPPSK